MWNVSYPADQALERNKAICSNCTEYVYTHRIIAHKERKGNLSWLTLNVFFDKFRNNRKRQILREKFKKYVFENSILNITLSSELVEEKIVIIQWKKNFTLNKKLIYSWIIATELTKFCHWKSKEQNWK